MANISTKEVAPEVVDKEAKNLSKLFIGANRAEFARIHNLNPTLIQQHITGIRPISLTYAKAYAAAFDCDLEKISERISKYIHEAMNFSSNTSEIQNGEFYMIPVMDMRLSAGTGNIVVSDDVRKKLAFRTDYLKSQGAKPENVIGFPVDGDSMIDVHIIDGAIVVIDRSKKEPRKNKYFGMWIEEKYLIKEIVKIGDLWVARSHNAEKRDKYPDIPIDQENSGIIGRAFWCGFKL